MFGLPGGMEWLVILLVALLIFGGRKIPELMRGLGAGIREFKQAASGQPSTPSNEKSEQQ
ncbi:MAG: twin-arginine translocase TatA/TatE family subunit [Bacteroidota bacterium]|nr:twin-arginine translocase TatA/TatE family subunit [Candidatus Kapabacteria bacterium]MCS7302449.1 twin-arginine translocase TatA/TatE family subunit [Candidatus Kapabacteria bacterium]MCX7936338.1 twin-arginine translocase TatA/TatE family subunit [Chlorobiota bacterium]MDW8074381.1 twin-arginine translocase TatA/TatE family subunit [Bacteroidota bacterium]MDW8271143.1 twin-arginine translocase TatA/TatE family subunit [Bacteroidota bacterium]